MSEQRDQIYQNALNQVPDFRFDDSVVRVFPDMIQRSVPGYLPILEQLPLLARRVVSPGSRVYDLGCSLGAVTLSLRRAIQQPETRIIAVDRSSAMIRRCRQLIDQDNSVVPVDVVEADIIDYPIEQASLVVLNFTLQFIERQQRLQLLQRISDGLLPGGALVIAEKVRFDAADEQQLMTEWHHDFKRAQGYSDLEIAQKRAALENVLLPDTLEEHHERLRAIGLETVATWFRCLNFVAMIGFKPA
ncbi:MAG: carboxy-S-adenosyl-L-methionine synthase CmoA [Wenzhouxiangellaceae bacterium]